MVTCDFCSHAVRRNYFPGSHIKNVFKAKCEWNARTVVSWIYMYRLFRIQLSLLLRILYKWGCLTQSGNVCIFGLSLSAGLAKRCHYFNVLPHRTIFYAPGVVQSLNLIKLNLMPYVFTGKGSVLCFIITWWLIMLLRIQQVELLAYKWIFKIVIKGKEGPGILGVTYSLISA